MQSTINLLTAVQQGDTDAIHVLLSADVLQSDLNSALCWSARLGSCDITEMLLSAGADPNCRLWGGFSPLLWATIFSENAEIMHLLLRSGSSVNCASYRRRQTVLHAAVIRGSAEFTSILLGHGANPDKQDYLSRTPLHYAIQRSNLQAIKMLLTHNCNVNICGVHNGEYISPLYWALLQDNLEAAKMLLLAGAKFNQPTIYCTVTVNQFYRTIEETLKMQVRPVYLQQQCRVCIRHQFSYDILKKLEQLVFPKRLKDFIRLEELDHCCCGH
ncbi:ankyrin repeat and SOCS box protein 8-like [Liolophura sinensis]|uniref:ankyrin repeat and SOCS box protein 8-like n=1 Tax=Liolophura sinensis TaxID=3198878 RepID=UPI0031597E12